jgi:indolepyruvate ferredoxin oxidoreductase beta subunit
MKLNAVLAGVGGQGVVTVARLLAQAALRDGLEIIQGELHGMSQRGGTVHAQLRMSNEPLMSPQVPKGRADLIIGMEPSEALRFSGWLSPTGHIISASDPVVNVPDYPPIEDIHAAILDYPGSLLVDARKIAKEAGSLRAENFAVAGAAIAYLPITLESLEACILEKSARWKDRDRNAAIAAIKVGFALGTEAAAAQV